MHVRVCSCMLMRGCMRVCVPGCMQAWHVCIPWQVFSSENWLVRIYQLLPNEINDSLTHSPVAAPITLTSIGVTVPAVPINALHIDGAWLAMRPLVGDQ